MACSVQGRPEKVRLAKSEAKSMLTVFLDIKGIHDKEFLHTAVTFYGECMKSAKTSPRTLAT
jgi:hypothetical protein